ncbi:hypothetical protein ACIRVF_23280 [Kitasatospora sp. NPDC101157]
MVAPLQLTLLSSAMEPRSLRMISGYEPVVRAQPSWGAVRSPAASMTPAE